MEKEEIIIDAENAVMGRLASYAAKQALKGKEVIIVNSEKAIITGSRENITRDYRQRKARGGSSLKGPFISSLPERLLKRTIRGMLPYKKGRGKEAFKKIKCYSGIPEEFQGKKIIKAGRGGKGINLDYISKMLKGKI